MILVAEAQGLWLERDGYRFRLTERDWFHLVRMTPMGRKVYFRRRAQELGETPEGGSGAELLLAWSRLPAREWDIPLA
jgi:hypothetical protein